MNLPFSIRRLLSWLRLGRSPQQQVRSRVDVPVTFTAGVAAVPDPPPADLDRFEKTSRIDPAVQRRVPVAPDDKFGRAGVPRTRGGSQLYGPADDLNGPTNRGRWTPS